MAKLSDVEQLRSSHAEHVLRQVMGARPAQGESAETRKLVADNLIADAHRRIAATLWAFHEGRFVVLHGEDASRAHKVFQSHLENDEGLSESEGQPCLTLHRDRWTDRCRLLQDAGFIIVQQQE